MRIEQRKQYKERDGILKLLSDEEIDQVSDAEAGGALGKGEQYLSLDQLEQGVRTASGDPMPMARVLPRKAVKAETWASILKQMP